MPIVLYLFNSWHIYKAKESSKDKKEEKEPKDKGKEKDKTKEKSSKSATRLVAVRDCQPLY